MYFTAVEVNNGGYLPCHFVAQLISTNIDHQHFGEYLFWYIPYRNQKKLVHFCQYNEKWLKLILSLHLLGSEYYLLISSEQRNQCTWKALFTWVCDIFWQVMFACVRFFVNCCVQKIKKAKSNLPVLLFHVISLLFIENCM